MSGKLEEEHVYSKVGECFQEENSNINVLLSGIENLRTSSTSVISDISLPLDDALSITTDSTATTTEYESANENDISSNRMSSCTDISCDGSIDVKSFKNSVNEDLHKREMENLYKLNINPEIMSCKENVSEAGPATAADIENINNVPFLNDSSELDFISKVGGTGLVAETLRKQSLYVKFDPLVSQEVDSSFTNDDTLKLDDSNSRSISNESKNYTKKEVNVSTDENTSSEVTNSKTSENGSIGKLISVTPNKSPRNVTPRSSPRYTDCDPDDVAKLQSLLLKQMKKEEAFKEEVESVKQDYDQVLKKLHDSEQENKNLKSLLETVQENEKKLKNELVERIKSKQQLSLIMEEYEKTMSQIVSRRDEEQKEYEAAVKKIEAERDSTLQHLNNLENAFNDIHQKYERGKAVNEALKKNEDLLKKSLSEYETTVKTVENKYELLKSHATSQLEKANQELELITQSYEKEQAKLKAMLRKSEIQINSLQNALERKSKENQELTAICDELIVKLSTHSNA